MKKNILFLWFIIAGMGLLFSQEISIKAPVGGERLERGKRFTIRWTSKNLTGKVNVLLRKGKTDLGPIVQNQPAAGSYSWNVGDPLTNGTRTYPDGSDYKIRVRSISNPQTADKSNFITIYSYEIRANPNPPRYPQIAVAQPSVPRGTLTPSILRFVPKKTPVNEGEPVELEIIMQNVTSAYIREKVAGKVHTVTGITRGKYNKTLRIPMASRQSTLLKLTAKNDWGETTKDTYIQWIGFPKIAYFRADPPQVDFGTYPWLKFKYVNADYGQITNLRTGDKVRVGGHKDKNGNVIRFRESAWMATPGKTSKYKMEVFGPNGHDEAFTEVTVFLPAEIKYGYPKPTNIAGDGTVSYLYHFKNARKAYVIDVWNGKEKVKDIPVTKDDQEGKVNFTIVHPACYALTIEDRNGKKITNKCSSVLLSGPRQSIKSFKIDRLRGAGTISDSTMVFWEYEMIGAKYVEIYYKSSSGFKKIFHKNLYRFNHVKYHSVKTDNKAHFPFGSKWPRGGVARYYYKVTYWDNTHVVKHFEIK